MLRELTFDQAAIWTGRDRAALVALHHRKILRETRRDEQGRVLFSIYELCKLGEMGRPRTGRPRDLLKHEPASERSAA